MNRRWRIVTAALGFLAISGYLATGIVVVEPGEVVVVRRLGRALSRPMPPGLHWLAPMGIDRTDRVRTDEVRRLTVGLSGVPGPDDEPGAGEFLTGDLNLVKAEAVVQYRVSDPVAHVVSCREPNDLLRRLAGAALARSMSHRGIDATLREARSSVAAEAASELARTVDRHDLGLAILGVSLTDVRPPMEVRPAFAEAQTARDRANRLVLEAEGHASRVRSLAQAESDARLDRAHAEAHRTVTISHARATRFRSLLAEADRSRSLTVRRLYQHAMRDLLPRIGRTLVLSPEEPIDLSILDPSDVPSP